MFKNLALFFLVSGCATPAYSVAIHKIGPDTNWLGDGPDIVMTVRNNTDSRKRLTVECAGAPQDWVVEVEPRGEVRAMGQLMSINTRSEACRVVSAQTPGGIAEIVRW